MAKANSNCLVFVLNGERREVDLSQINPSTSLLSYLRCHTDYKGAKLGCGEGGCGACVVFLSKYNADSQKIYGFSISSCLTLLGSIAGCSIITSEGLGNCRDDYHAIHKRIAGFHASQCGYCTPGWCMSLYGALHQAEAKGAHELRQGFSNLSVLEAEKSIAGNLCRCTGYRPIADVCKSFAAEVDLEDLGLNSFWKKKEIPDLNKLPKYDRAAVQTNPKFCSQKCEESGTPTLNFAYKDEFDGEQRVWIRPSNLEETLGTLKETAKENVELKLVVGNTSAGIYKNVRPKVFVDISNIPELQIIKRHEFGIEIGAAVTISNLIEVLEDANDVLDPGKLVYPRNLIFEIIGNHLKKVASGFIRNTASIGGNLIMAKKLSFDSDLATILLGASATVKIISIEKIESVLTMEEFLDKPCLDSGALLLSVRIPYWNKVNNRVEDSDINGSFECYENLFKTYRAAPRPLGNAVSYVNAAFLAQISLNKPQGHLIAKSLRLAFGAFGVKHAIRAKSIEEFLIDKVISSSILLEAIEMLKAHIIPVEGTSKSAYRQSVAVGFLFDFFCPFVNNMVPPCIIDPREVSNSQSGITPNTMNWSCKPKSLTSGKQTMEFHLEYHPVGQPSSKVAAELQASGEVVYVDDIPSPKNCLYGAYVYSEKALALIKKVDVKHVLESPSVVSYISSSDIPKQGRNIGAEALFGGETLLAEDTVECIGQPIGLMVANTWHDAKRAADKVTVDYDCETLGPPILSVEDAREKESFFPVPEWFAPKPIGDFAEGMSEADHNIESAEVKIGSQYFFYLENQTALAVPDEDECMVVYSSCQNPCILQTSIAKCLGIPINNVRVITRRVGGGFGGKAFRSVPVAVTCALAAYKLKRPVRMYLDRTTDMITTGGRHPIKANYTVGFKSDGKITALHVDLFIDAGFSPDISPALPYNIISAMKKYNWGALSFDYKVCKTNLPSKSAMRGPGDAQGSFIAENIIEHVASILGLDSIVVREKNLHTFESAVFFYGSYVESPIGYTLPSIWEKLKQSASMNERMKNIRDFNAANRWFKRGLSMVPCFFLAMLTPRPARVTIFGDGSIAVEVGGVELGQGIWTKVKQMTTYALGQLWPGLSEDIMSKVRIVQTDSISLAHGGITSGSTTSEGSCEAVRHACNILVERLHPIETYLKKSSPNGFCWKDLIFQLKPWVFFLVLRLKCNQWIFLHKFTGFLIQILQNISILVQQQVRLRLTFFREQLQYFKQISFMTVEEA
ncbi:indole-3-acetaldehyde oxidase isoform X2 [Cryptomeria japonica]|uniref:indole-3-acetaldehyde oxidase isoform X2 n=1 Tax=Cryptomeria japonica TaxID=3369 RepID=UPI0027D9D3E6|nr:indole-3-acetaldehyde oxidase isoform X2 [Cryptomeria japonica]